MFKINERFFWYKKKLVFTNKTGNTFLILL
jgi:hypothetical protein